MPHPEIIVMEIIWFCVGLCWSLPVSLFCAGFVLVSPGLCRILPFSQVKNKLQFLCWSLLVSAGFVVLCWFCAGLCWSLPVSLFCAGFVLVSAGFVALCWFCAGLCWSLPVSLLCWFCVGLCWSQTSPPCSATRRQN
jgi:hypothetical protein